MNRSLTIALVAVVALGAATAASGAKSFSSQVKITGYSLGFFEGQVRSSFEKCEDKRGVELWEPRRSGQRQAARRRQDRRQRRLVDGRPHGTGGTYYAVARNKTGKYRKPNGKRKKYQCPEVVSAPFVR